MGIHHFFAWLRKQPNFQDHLPLVAALPPHVGVDDLLIDLNGVIHYAAQKVYGYGMFAPPKSLLECDEKKGAAAAAPFRDSLHKQLAVYKCVAEYVGSLVALVQPRQHVVIAIDGVAPLAKQIQQKKRRFKASLTGDPSSFDSCSITPGTLWLYNLGKYLDWHLRKYSRRWTDHPVTMVLSNQQVAGEGEHKLMQFVRIRSDPNASLMLYGMDADLIMLALATHRKPFYILRETQHYNNKFYLVDIGGIREVLPLFISAHIQMDLNPVVPEEAPLINDLILVFFLVGNDFLPKVPTVGLFSTIDDIFVAYGTILRQFGHLTHGNGKINGDVLREFFQHAAQTENQYLIGQTSTFPDTLLDQYRVKGESVDFKAYRSAYYTLKMGLDSIDLETQVQKVVVEYLHGVQWVLDYYLHGADRAGWKSLYPRNYAPFLSDLSRYCGGFQPVLPLGKQARPYEPFMQLLCVTPPRSSALLPAPLRPIVERESEVKYSIDTDGVDREYEAVVCLPLTQFQAIEQEYKATVPLLEPRDTVRNRFGKAQIYRHVAPYVFQSFYGDQHECEVSPEPL